VSRELDNTLLAVLFAVGEPVLPEKIAQAMELDAKAVGQMLEDLRFRLDEQSGALVILRLDDRYQLATRECYTPVIQKVLSERKNTPLSPAAMEVLAAVACNQPVTRAYIEQVRGVDSSGIVASLTEKGLLEEAGRLELPGPHRVPHDGAFSCARSGWAPSTNWRRRFAPRTRLPRRTG
jgi:segregation and condensation protein B